MTERIQNLYIKMIEFESGMPDLIQHFTKVHAYCQLIAAGEGITGEVLETLEAAALVHDIAIPLCLKKYGNCAGNLQEQEGTALVHAMLPELNFTDAQIQRVSWLVAHHHTYNPIEGIDHQILVEADFIVNAFEGNHSPQTKQNTLSNIFQTQTGKTIYQTMFNL